MITVPTEDLRQGRPSVLAARQAERRHTQPPTERERATSRRYARRKRLESYGLTPDDYDQMLATQGGVCAICHQPERVVDASTGLPRQLAVDHSHLNGDVRALLCLSCNYSVVGALEELMRRYGRERLAAAFEYILTHDSTSNQEAA
jgi:hypothetical protein